MAHASDRKSWRMNRRRLFQHGASGAGALVLASQLGPAALAQEATPFGAPESQGGTAVIGMNFTGNPRGFVPTSFYGSLSFLVGKMLYTPLLLLQSDWRTIGAGLAREWEWSEENTVLTMSLRDDVVFHDGTPFTAADAEFTYRLGVRYDPFFTSRDVSIFQGGPEYKEASTEDFPGVQLLDDHTIQFRLTSPSSVFELHVSNTGILPKHMFADDVLTSGTAMDQLPFFNGESGTESGLPIGTGPWKATGYNPESNLTFERNENYFLGAPILDEIIYRFGVQGPAAIAGLQAGEFDSALVAGPEDARSLESTENVSILPNFDLANEAMLIFATEKEHLSVPVRQALLTAIDRDALIETLTYGYGQPAPCYMMHPSLLPNSNLATYAFDADRARELLDEAGWDWDYSIKFGRFTSQGAPDPTVSAIMSMWSDIGVNVEFLPLDSAAQVEISRNDEHPYDVTLSVPAWLAYDPSSSYTQFGCEFRPNYSNYCNPDFDEAMQTAMRAPTLEEAIPHYQTGQEILQEELPYAPLWMEAEIWAVNDRMHGGILGRGPLNDIHSEQWWKETE